MFKQGKRATLLLYIGIFISLLTTNIFYFYVDMINKENSYLEEQSKYLDMEFRSISIALSSTAVAILNNVVNQDDIVNLLDSASKEQDNEKLNIIRQELYKKLLPIYNNLQKQNIRQFHFHLPKAISFIRFHRPNKYGDSLWKVRDSIKMVNIDKRYISGFEEGRVFNGFRHVFPLFNRKDDFIGTVEISYSFTAIEKMAKEIYPAVYTFMLKKSIISDKVWKNEQTNYTISNINSEYLFDKNFLNSVNTGLDIENINRTLQPYIAERISNGERFSIPFENIDGTNYVISFMPIKNIVGDQAAYYISYKPDHNFLRIESEFHQNVVFWTLFILLFTASIIFIIEARKRDSFSSSIKEEKGYIKKIFDSQNTIMFISNGKKITDINNSFSEYFGFNSIKEFNKLYTCICELAEKVEGDSSYLYNSSLENWQDIISKDNENIYKMKFNVDGITSIFYINVDRIKLNGKYNYIVSLIDVTDKENSLMKHEYNTQFDTLTKIANRYKLDSILRIEIGKSIHEDLSLSLIVFDIDNFKSINEKFGFDTGDSILLELSRVATETISTNSDYNIARWGGEEFAVVLPETTLNKAKEVAELIRESINNYTFKGIDNLTCSFGVAEFRESDTQDSLLQRADMALDVAKSRGKNRVEVED